MLQIRVGINFISSSTLFKSQKHNIGLCDTFKKIYLIQLILKLVILKIQAFRSIYTFGSRKINTFVDRHIFKFFKVGIALCPS